MLYLQSNYTAYNFQLSELFSCDGLFGLFYWFLRKKLLRLQLRLNFPKVVRKLELKVLRSMLTVLGAFRSHFLIHTIFLRDGNILTRSLAPMPIEAFLFNSNRKYN